MPRPSGRGDIKPNQAYLKDWDEYQKDRPGSTPILLPVSVDINAKGELVRDRMKAGDIEKIYETNNCDIPDFMRERRDINPYDPKDVFGDYIGYFKDIDAAQGPVPTPLDINISKPVWVLYYLPRKNWKFTNDRQYSTVNDPDDMYRNFEKICTMDKRNYLLLSNRCRSNPKGLKFNLHVTISQMTDGVKMKTPIIIDPGSNNLPGWPG